MRGSVTGRWLLAASLLSLPPVAVHAERYAAQVDLGTGTPIVVYCDDSTSYVGRLGQGQAGDGLVPAPSTFTYRTAAEVGQAVADGSSPAGPRVTTPIAGPVQPRDGFGLTGATPSPRPPSEPSPEFVRRLSEFYGITAEEAVRAAWKLFRGMADRPGGPLSFEARVDNAVVAALIGRSEPFASGAGGVDPLAGLTGSAARVRSSSGASLRSDPWGDPTGVVPRGTTVDLLSPPDEEGWCRVRHEGREGWVSGLWLEP